MLKGSRYHHSIDFALLILLCLLSTLCNARPHEEKNFGNLQERSVNHRVKLAQDAKYHLNSLQGARQFCINFLKSDSVQTNTITSKTKTTTTTTSTITFQASTASATVSITVPGPTITTAVTPTVTQTVTSTGMTTMMRRRRSSDKSSLFSFSHEIIKDACLLFLYGSLQPPPGSTATKTSTSTITSTVKTTTTATVNSVTVTFISSYSSNTFTVTTLTNAPTSTFTSTVTAAPSTVTFTAPPSTVTVTQTISPSRFYITSDQGNFYIQDGGNTFLVIQSGMTPPTFNLRTGQVYSSTTVNLYKDGTDLLTYADNQGGQLFLFASGTAGGSNVPITCQLNLGGSFQCMDDSNSDYTTFYRCNGPYIFLYLASQPPPPPINSCTQITNVRYSMA